MCGARDIWEIPIPSSQFCYKRKTALKNKGFFFLNELIRCGHFILC